MFDLRKRTGAVVGKYPNGSTTPGATLLGQRSAIAYEVGCRVKTILRLLSILVCDSLNTRSTLM